MNEPSIAPGALDGADGESPMRVVVVTGMSGAGKTTAIHALEDLGYYAVDNLPTPVFAATLEACERGGMRRVAFGVGVQVRSFLDAVPELLDALPRSARHRVRVLFLDASDDALLRRFSATRRPHPLTTSDRPLPPSAAVLDGVELERRLLADVRARADRVIDSTNLSVHELRRQVLSDFGDAPGASLAMRTRLLSFGYKYGLPLDADLVFDVRFLKNPYFVEDLRDQTGLDDAVRAFVLGLPDAETLLAGLVAHLRFVLPRYASEGRSYLTVAVGCTGGRHRSVVLAEELARQLPASIAATVQHRDVTRTQGGTAASAARRGDDAG